MKLCNYCGNPFLPNGIHVTERQDGEWKSFNICKDCVQKINSKEEIKPLKNHTDIEIELIGSGTSSEELVKAAKDVMGFISGEQEKLPESMPPCPHCDLSLKDFFKTGKLGCVHCYKHYEDVLVSIFRIHQEGHDSHMGKIPQNWRQKQYDNDPDEMKKLLLLKKAKAVELEQYEEAAKFADEIRKLDNSSN